MKREHRTPTKAEMEAEMASYAEGIPEKSVGDTLKEAEDTLKEVEDTLGDTQEKPTEEPEKLTWTDEKPSDMPVSPIGEPIEGLPTVSNAPNFITEVVAMFHDLACTALNCRCFEFTDKLRASWNRIVAQFGPSDLKKFEKYLPYLGIVGLAATYIFMFKAHADHTKGEKPAKSVPQVVVPTQNAPSASVGKPRSTAPGIGIGTPTGSIGGLRNTMSG
jgi:hypothetical protein